MVTHQHSGPPRSMTPDLRTSTGRRAQLLLLGLTAGIPLMNFTVTGFSFVCLCFVITFAAQRDLIRNEAPLVLAGLGTVAYVMSTLVNGAPLRAPNLIAFAAVGLYLCGLSVLARTLEELFTILVGVSLGTMAFYAVLGTALTSDGLVADLWKYGLAPPVTMIALYSVATAGRRARTAPLVLLAALVLVSLALNYRSHAALCGASLLLVALDRLNPPRMPAAIKIGVVVAFAAVASWGLKVAATSGLLGASLTEKVELQSAQQAPSLLVGRSEPLLSLTAIRERPWLGWGSADNISTGVFDQARAWATQQGFDPTYPFEYVWRLSDGSVSLHSIILTSWAEAGIVGALLPLWLLWACLTLVFTAHRFVRWAPLLTYLGVQGAWDLAFSPWSYNGPIMFAIVACACTLVRHRRPAAA
ncbi:MAG: O-antigen ligase family protein [Aeromicrobium sp.]